MSGLKSVLLILYRATWVILFATGAATVTYFGFQEERGTIREVEAGQAIGFGIYNNQGPEGVVGGPYGNARRRSSFRDGDVLLTADGHRLPPAPEQDRRVAMLEGPSGSVVTLGVRHEDGTHEIIRVRRDPGMVRRAYAGSGISFAARRWMTFAVAMLAKAAALAAALLLFLRRPHDRVAQLLSATLVTTSSGIAGFIPGMSFALAMIVYLVGNTGLWLAILLFPDGRFATRWHVVVLALVIGVNAINIVQSAMSSFSMWSGVPDMLLSVAIVIAVLRQLRQTPPGPLRQQTKFVLFGIVAYSLLSFSAYCLLPLETIDLDEGTIGWIVFVKRMLYAAAGIAIPAGLLVSLLRYRLYDAETAISRSVAYGALTVGLVAIFAGSEKVIEILGEGYVGERMGALSSAIAAAVAAATIAPLHHRVTRWAERRFQGNLVHLRQGLPLLVGDLRETAEPGALADAMLVRIERGVRASHGAVVADGAVIAARDIGVDAADRWLSTRCDAAGECRLEIDRGDAVFPMRVPLQADGVGLVGWLLLGPRPDGSLYGKDERETLAAIADPLARALAISIERERRRAEQRQGEAAVRRTVDALCRFVQERFGVDVSGGAVAR